MQPHHKNICQAIIGGGGGAISWILSNAHDIASQVGFWCGVFAAVGSAFNILRGWIKNRNKD